MYQNCQSYQECHRTAMHLVGALNMDAETITCEDLLKLIKEVNV